jgi:hypothetical protein
MNGPHLSDIALVVLAASRKTHPHLSECAYCREQYEALVAMEELEEAEAEIAENPEAAAGRYRLAAQSGMEADVGLLPRQTWYLDQGRVLLRVFEEHAERLIGYVICAPERLPGMRIRFSGIEESFVPGPDGSFVIGEAELPIEPMTVTLDESA